MLHKLIVEKIDINSFRVLKNISLCFNEKYNEITGMNGTGKSSILDAIRYMICSYDADNKKIKNIKTISINNSFENEKSKFPKITLHLNYDNSPITLFTESDNWFINGIKQSSRSSYLKAFYDKINVCNDDDFVESFNPFIFAASLSSDRSNNANTEIKNNIIKMVNKLSDNKIINPNDYSKIIQDIETLKDQKRECENNIKDKNKEKQWFIEHNNIQDLDFQNINIEQENKNNFKKLEELKRQENKFEEINRNIGIEEQNYISCNNRINELNRELEKLKNSDFYTNSNNKFEFSTFEKVLLVFLYLLFIIPGIFYKKYLINKYSKNNRQNINNKSISMQIRNLENDIDELIKQRNRIENKIIELKNDVNFKDIDIRVIKEEIFALEQAINKHDFNEKLLQLKNFDDQINRLKNNLNEIEIKLSNKEEEKNDVNKKTNLLVKEIFPNFDLSLFDDEKNDETLAIKKDDIPLNYMNYSQKMNVIFELNDFFKHKRNIEVFFLIDGAESFNKIVSTNQVIAAKVNNDLDLKLNGKNIY